MSFDEIENMRLSGLSVEDVMSLEEKDLDKLLENIRIKLEEKRMHIEKSLEEF